MSGTRRNVLAKAMALTKETGEGFWHAELWRLRGRLLAHPGRNRPEAEACMAAAHAIAREQGALIFKLWAAVGLARFSSEGGNRNRGRDLLARIYGEFTEGFDTVDLREARSFLDELWLCRASPRPTPNTASAAFTG
jgi:predicted ATPase